MAQKVSRWQLAQAGLVGLLLVAFGVWVVVEDPSPLPDPTPTTTTAPALEWRDEPWWATPVDALEPGEQRWADRLCAYGDVSGSCGDRWTVEMGFAQGNDYSLPIYDAATATTERQVRRKRPDRWPGFFNLDASARVPWNDSWRPPAGKDAYMVVRDSRTGHEWGFWNVSWWAHWTADNNSTQCSPLFGAAQNLDPPWGVGFNPDTMLCAASAFQVRDRHGQPVDTRTWSGNFPASGGGWHVGPLIVTPDEVAEGVIRHALHFYSANTMDGPECPPDRRDGLGDTCGGAVAPAGQLEKTYFDGQPLAHQVPEGTRFSIDVKDSDIEAWLLRRGYEGRLRETARTIAVALRDYGWFLGDSSPNAAFWNFDGSTRAQARWRELGVQGDGKDLLRGLVTPERLRVWAPPVAQCHDGTESTWYCRADDVRYPR